MKYLFTAKKVFLKTKQNIFPSWNDSSRRGCRRRRRRRRRRRHAIPEQLVLVYGACKAPLFKLGWAGVA